MFNYRYSIIILLALTSFQLRAQIEYGGAPLMNHDDFSPSSVLYLLEPMDKEWEYSLKSASENSQKKALHFADERPIDLSPEMNGQWIDKNGISVWRAHIISPGAYSLGLSFSEFELSSNASLFVYTPDGQEVKGAFTSANNKSYGTFNIGHLPGNEVIVELQLHTPGMEYGKLRIASVFHAFLPVFSSRNALNTGLGESQDCEIDINCEEGDEWQIIKGSVCHISTGTLLCTGALINNTLYDGNPYVLTAEHCINKEFRAQGSVFYFGYENSSCGINDALKNQSISGSNLLATGDSLDFTLLKLSKRPPKSYEVYYAGWDARPQDHSQAISLHHPNADAMKISYEMDGTVEATTVPGDLNDYIISSNYHIRKWDIGSTEGGSSGAPLFNSSKKLIGVLSGGLAACGDSIGYDEVAQRPIFSKVGNEDDYYSKIYVAWDYYDLKNKQLKGWLDPAGSGQMHIGGLSSLLVGKEDKIPGRQTLVLYPNPANDKVTIRSPEHTGDELRVNLYSISGRKVFEKSYLSVDPIQLEVSGLEQGVYLVRLTSRSQQLTGSLIIRR